MNLTAMLNMKVRPLSTQTKQAPVVTWVRNTKGANEAKRNTAIARYRKVMGSEWCGTRTIECRLGMGRSCCLPNLNKWFTEGILEKRKVCLNPDWNRNKGYEWRFAKHG